MLPFASCGKLAPLLGVAKCRAAAPGGLANGDYRHRHDARLTRRCYGNVSLQDLILRPTLLAAC